MIEVFEPLEPGKEHYSEDIKMILTKHANLGRTVILVFPPGLGKTRMFAETSIELLAEESPINTILGKTVYAVHCYEPTHATLRSFAEKVKEAYMDALRRGYFRLRLPMICIVRGSIFSCINDEHRQLFRQAIHTILAATRLSLTEGYKLLEALETRWGELPLREKAEIVRRLTEYSIWSHIEMSITYLCMVCPYGRSAKFGKLIEALSQSGVDIVDTEAQEAKKLIAELHARGYLDDPEVCLYRALLDLAVAESQYRDKLKRPHLMCLTHALYTNPALCEKIEARYSIVASSGKYARQIALIDEVDQIYASPTELVIPIHLNPHLKVIEDEIYDEATGQRRRVKTWLSSTIIRRSARKFTLSTNLKYLCELLSMIEDFWQDAWVDVIANPRLTPLEKVVRLGRKVLELVKKLSEYPSENLSKARQAYRLWREGLAEQLKKRSSNVTPLDLVCFSIAGKVLNLVTNIREYRLADAHPSSIMSRIMTPLLYRDIRNWYSIELDTRLGIARIGMAGISIPLYEHALRLCLDPKYPLPYLLKVGATATFSKGYIASLLRTIAEDIASKIAGADTVIVYGEAPYVNVHFYRILVWLSGDTYNRLVKAGLRDLPTIVADISREREELMSGLARKALLLQPTMSETLHRLARQHRKAIHFASDIFLNTVHEAVSILARRGWLKDRHMVALFTGTKAQMLAIMRDLVTLSDLPEIEHGYARIKVRYATLDRELLVGKATVRVEYGGKTSTLEMLIGHARGRLGRGIDLDEYDVAIIMAPPLQLPTSLKSYLTRVHYEIRDIYQKAATATEQALFRVVRRCVYPFPKLILVENTLCSEQYMTYYTPTFRKRLERALLSPALEKVRIGLSLVA